MANILRGLNEKSMAFAKFPGPRPSYHHPADLGGVDAGSR
jgi:hypothetical protein